MVTGSLNLYYCIFEFNEVWQSFSKFAIFKKEENIYGPVLIADGKCKVPYEVIKEEGIFELGVYGSDGERRISSKWCRVKVNDGVYTANITAPGIPEGDVWEEYVEYLDRMLNNIVPQIGENGNWQVWNPEADKYEDSGKSSKGNDGYAPIRGIDYWTEWDKDEIFSEVEEKIDIKQDKLKFDTVPTELSKNPVTSAGIYEALADKLEYITGYESEIDGYIPQNDGIIEMYKIVGTKRDSQDTNFLPYILIVSKVGVKFSQISINRNGRIRIRSGKNALWNEWDVMPYSSEIVSQLNTKVDKETGKGLSSNDYTDEEKLKLNNIKLIAVPRGVVSGSLIKLTDHIKNESLISCKVYGTASGVGDLVESGEHAGKYRVAVAIRGKNLFDVNDFANLSNVQVDGNNITITDATNNVVAISAPDLMKRLKKGQNYSGLDKWTLDSGTQVATTGRIALVPKSSGSNLYFSYGTNFTNVTIPNEPSTYYLALFATANGVVTFENIQIEEGATYTDYEPYQKIVKEVYLDEPLGVDEYVSIDGLSTISSVVYIESDNTNAPDDIEVEYYRDINKVISNLENAIST